MGGIAVATGAQQGIGAAICEAFGRQGARVAAACGGVAIQADIATAAETERLPALTGAMALALAPHGIRVKAIAPGLTGTAQPRHGNTEAEIAELACFLASGQSRWITGQVHRINGGLWMP